MPTFRIPSFLQTRRSFNRLRSFHLTPAEVRAIGKNPYAKEDPGAEKPLTLRQRIEEKFAGALIPRVELPPIPRPANLVVPLRASTIVILACILSFFFIVSISCAFIGADAGEPFFKNTLNKLAVESPGVSSVFSNSINTELTFSLSWSLLEKASTLTLTNPPSPSGGLSWPAETILSFQAQAAHTMSKPAVSLIPRSTSLLTAIIPLPQSTTLPKSHSTANPVIEGPFKTSYNSTATMSWTSMKRAYTPSIPTC